MNRVRNEEVRMRAGIEREVASKTDQRLLRLFEHVERMDEYRMARKVLKADVSGWRVRGRLDGSCEGGLGQRRNDGGGCALMRERLERVESPGTYVTE